MAKTKWKKFLWPKKTSRKVLMACIYVACVYLILGGFGIVPLIAAPTGFMNWGAESINGIPIGSSQFTESGQFSISSGGIPWDGRIVVGNMYYDGQSDLGFLTSGNTSTALRQLNYHSSIMAYTLQSPTNMLPGLYAVQNGYIGTQYAYCYYNFWGIRASEYDVNAQLRANYLSIPSNYVAMTSNYLNLNLGVNIQLDPTLLGVQSYQTETQYYNMTGVWAGVLSANAAANYEGGLISAPGTILVGANFTQKPVDPAPTSTSGYSASNVGVDSTISNWLNTYDPDGNHFGVTTASSTMYQAGAAQLGMGSGDPVTLTEGAWNANATLGQVYNAGMLADEYRNYVVGYIPLTLRPQTTITQTTYTYDSFSIVNAWWYGLSGTALRGVTTTKPTAVDVKNSFVIQRVNFVVLVAANYTITPLTGGDYPDVEPPVINGTDTVFNANVLSQVHDVTGNTAATFQDLLDALGGFGLWLIVIIIAVVVAVLVWRFAKPGKKRK